MSGNFDWTVILTLTHVVLASGVTAHAVLKKRDSRAAIGWTSLAWLAPFLGALAYLVLGINRINRAGTRLGLSDAMRGNPEFHPSENELELAREGLERYPNFAGLARAGEA
ncbi:MAG: PLDc N-terminal domain-containing protein, partial [Rhizobiaceae bacterium]